MSTLLKLLVPVARAADDAKTATGRIALSVDDPCLVIGYGTSFTQLKPRMQLMFPKSVGSPVAEVLEVISDTEVRVKKEFSGETGKKTAKIMEKLREVKNSSGVDGLDFKTMPYIDQGTMYGEVYRRLTEGGAIAIFPEGTGLHSV